jgi:hypothetical protein
MLDAFSILAGLLEWRGLAKEAEVEITRAGGLIFSKEQSWPRRHTDRDVLLRRHEASKEEKL